MKNSTQQIIFESGALNDDGSIVGNDNYADAAHYEPHYSEIRSADQVQIYEAILEGTKGGITTGYWQPLATPRTIGCCRGL